MPLSHGQRTRFECASPILSVADMSPSVRYYVEVLGFTNADWGGDTFTCVTRDNAGIYLSQGDQGQPGTWAWVGAEDVAALYEEYSASGATIRHPPANYPWTDDGGRRSRWTRAPLRIGTEDRSTIRRLKFIFWESSGLDSTSAPSRIGSILTRLALLG